MAREAGGRGGVVPGHVAPSLQTRHGFGWTAGELFHKHPPPVPEVLFAYSFVYTVLSYKTYRKIQKEIQICHESFVNENISKIHLLLELKVRIMNLF